MIAAMNPRAAKTDRKHPVHTLTDAIERSRAMLDALDEDDWEQFHSLMRARDRALAGALADRTAAPDSPRSLREIIALNEECLRRAAAARSELETRLQRLNQAKNATQRYRQSA